MAVGRAKKLGFGVLFALVLLGFSELGLRLAVPRERLLFAWERPNGVLYANSSGRTVMNPNQSSTQRDGPHAWTLRINSQGFREDADIPLERPAGQARWLALGDSWMFGYNAEQGKTLPDRLEAGLPAVLGQPVEVINNGQFGGSAFDMLVAWRAGQALRPDAVLLGWPHNAWRQRDMREVRRNWYAQTRPGPRSGSRLYLLLRYLSFRVTRPLNPTITGDEVSEALGDLSVIASEAQSLGIPTYFVYFPTQYGARADVQEVEMIGRVLRPLGVRLTGHSLPQRACWGHEDLFHPSEAGYAAIAARVVALVRDGESSVVVAANPSCKDVEGDGPEKATP